MDVWFAPLDLSPGDRLSDIHDHIASSDFVVVILSSSSVNSRWVRHEWKTALALSLGGNFVRVIPVRIDNTPPPADFADIVVVDLQPRRRADGLAELIATLTGEVTQARSTVDQFVEYVSSLVLLDHDLWNTIDSFCIQNCRAEAVARGETERTFLADVARKRRLGILDRTRCLIAEKLADSGVSNAEKDRILIAFDEYRPLPAICLRDRERIQSWARTAHESLLNVAADLYALALRGKHGVTLRWFCGRCEGDSSMVSSRDQEWHAEELVEQARNKGLLSRSTEYLPKGTYAARDAETNPGYDLGPMVFLVGKHFLYFRSTRAGPEAAADGEDAAAEP